MRKSIWILTALTLCAVLVVTAAASSLQGSRDEIIVTEETVAGDPAAAKGLQVQTTLNLQRQMFWKTSYEVCAEPEAETDFRFYQSRQQHPYEERMGDVTISLASKNFGISGRVSLDAEDHDADLMMEPVKDVASRTNAGETRTEVVQMCQYYDWYPLQMDPISHGVDGLMFIKTAQSVFLQQYFRIPVPEEDCIEVTVQKNENGEVVDVDCSDWYGNYADKPPAQVVRADDPDDPDSFSAYEEKEAPLYMEEPAYLFSDSVVTEDWAYLLLCGNVDLSHGQSGYGLYRIPITWHEQWENYRYSEPQPHLELEQIQNIYPMDPAFSENVRLEAGKAETELLLFEDTAAGLVLTVLDTTDFSVMQQMELGQQVHPSVWHHEEMLILQYWDYEAESQYLQVLQWQDGQYSFWMETEDFPTSGYGILSAPVFCFDGERLALANYNEYYGSTTHRIMVYDQTGLLYTGDYFYSSDQLPEPPNTWNWEDTLQISWDPFA